MFPIFRLLSAYAARCSEAYAIAELISANLHMSGQSIPDSGDALLTQVSLLQRQHRHEGIASAAHSTPITIIA